MQKSNLYVVGVDSVEALEVAKMTDCKLGTLPFIYLRLPMGEKNESAR